MDGGAAGLEFDVCIVGTGVAGGLLAAALASTGKRIALVEAGPWHNRAEVQQRLAAGGSEPYLFHNAEHLKVPVTVNTNIDWAYLQSKRVGGNSIFWGAWAIRPLESHFQLRKRYRKGLDWPLSYKELEPLYCRAEEELGVSGQPGGEDEPRRSKPYPLPAFPVSYAGQQFARACKALGYETHPIPVARTSRSYRNRAACCIAAQCWTCPTTAKYSSDFSHVRDALGSDNVTLLEQTVASKLVVGANGQVEHLVCHKPDRTTLKLRAGVFVLACNAIESARLLLLSAQERHPQGLANSSGLVGRNLMVHPSLEVPARAAAPLLPARSWPTIYTRHFEDGRHRRRYAGFRIAQGRGDLPLQQARALVELGMFGREFLQNYRRSLTSCFNLLVDLEMLPDPDNRIELDPDHRDAFGNPGLKVTLRLSDYELNAWKAIEPVLKKLIQEMQGTLLSPDPHWTGGHHQMGTLRMGTNPRASVVNRNLRTHDVPNLYIASTAVFPTSLGPTNPTLTLAALTIQLAHHLRKKVLA